MIRKIIFALSITAAYAYAGSIATTPVVPSLQNTDRIPIGRPGGTIAYATTPLQIYSKYTSTSRSAITLQRLGISSYNGSAGFSTISTNAIYIRQGDNAQAIELYEAAANGNSTVTIEVQGQMSSSRVLTIGNHGLYVDGIPVVTW
jgi:hypothetical protein